MRIGLLRAVCYRIVYANMLFISLISLFLQAQITVWDNFRRISSVGLLDVGSRPINGRSELVWPAPRLARYRCAVRTTFFDSPGKRPLKHKFTEQSWALGKWTFSRRCLLMHCLTQYVIGK